jgi:adenylate kinase family enzyme
MVEPRTIVVLGRSGSGKGTQVDLLEKKLLPSLVIHTGKLFRELEKKKNAVGSRVREMLKNGELAPMWLASALWQGSLTKSLKPRDHLLFDGAPRGSRRRV